MRVALVGTSHVHTPDFLVVLDELPWTDLVGIACPDPDTRLGANEQVPVDGSVPVVAAIDELPPHDLAVITTDIASHEEVCRQSRAPALFIEKPLALDGARAAHLADALRSDGRRIEVGFFMRHAAPFDALLAEVRSDSIGSVRQVGMAYAHPGLSEGWLRRWPAHLDTARMGGGVFVDLAVHLIDAARMIVGDLLVRGADLDRSGSGGLDLQGQAILSGAGGELVHIWTSGIAPRVVQRVHVVCERGEVTMDAGVTTLLANGEAKILKDGPMPSPADGFRTALERLRVGEAPATSLADAVAANDVMDAIARQSELKGG